MNRREGRIVLRSMMEAAAHHWRLASKLAATLPVTEAGADPTVMRERLTRISEFGDAVLLLWDSEPAAALMPRGMLETALNAMHALGVAPTAAFTALAQGVVGSWSVDERLDAMARQPATADVAESFRGLGKAMDASAPAGMQGPWLGKLTSGIPLPSIGQAAGDLVQASQALHDLFQAIVARQVPPVPGAAAVLAESEAALGKMRGLMQILSP